MKLVEEIFAEDDTFVLLFEDGIRAVFDVADSEMIQRYRWNVVHRPGARHFFSAYDKSSKKVIGLNSLFRTGNAPILDHINGDDTNYRRANLRSCGFAENMQNKRMAAKKLVPFKGVTPQAGRFLAQIRTGRRLQHLGSFRDAESAARAYDDAARRKFGAFACLNFPELGEQSAFRGIAQTDRSFSTKVE